MAYAYVSTGERDPLEVWRECREQMERAGMNPELLELAGDLAAETRERDTGVPPAVLLARLAARLNALIVLGQDDNEEVPGAFIVTLIGIAAAELAP